MKPTNQQQQWLIQRFGQVFTYRETFEEVYDHVITGLIDQHKTISFNEMVDNIVKEDFGGYDKLHVLEKASKKNATKNSLKILVSHFAGYFKFPSLLYVAMGAAATYYLIDTLQIHLWSLWAIFLLTLLIQLLAGILGGSKIFGALKTKYKEVGQVFNHTRIKPSLKDSVFRIMMSTPFYLFLCIYVALALFGYDISTLPGSIRSSVITLFLTAYTVYTLSLRKFYSEDLEAGIVRMIFKTE